MKKRRSMFLSDYIVEQYPIEDYKEIIFITLDIVENFLLVLERVFNYDSTSVASYGEKYGSSQRNNNSKIESIYIKNLQTQEAMENFLKTYFDAYNSLNQDEKDIFDATFIDKLCDLEIIARYNTHSKHIRMVRKSAIVRFTLRSGLNNFISLIK